MPPVVSYVCCEVSPEIGFDSVSVHDTSRVSGNITTEMSPRLRITRSERIMKSAAMPLCTKYIAATMTVLAVASLVELNGCWYHYEYLHENYALSLHHDADTNATCSRRNLLTNYLCIGWFLGIAETMVTVRIVHVRKHRALLVVADGLSSCLRFHSILLSIENTPVVFT